MPAEESSGTNKSLSSAFRDLLKAHSLNNNKSSSNQDNEMETKLNSGTNFPNGVRHIMHIAQGTA